VSLFDRVARTAADRERISRRDLAQRAATPASAPSRIELAARAVADAPMSRRGVLGLGAAVTALAVGASRARAQAIDCGQYEACNPLGHPCCLPGYHCTGGTHCCPPGKKVCNEFRDGKLVRLLLRSRRVLRRVAVRRPGARARSRARALPAQPLVR
jgi:hypothetical protein